MPYHKKNSGFTLVELIAVISILAIVLSFAIPRIPGTIFKNNANETALWLIVNVKALKEQALQENVRYFLNLDINNGIMWISNDFMADDEGLKEDAKQNGHTLPEGLRLLDVEFPEMERQLMIERIKQNHPDYIDGVKVAEYDTADGFRFILSDKTWLLVRFSGTEPLLRIYAESNIPERVERLLKLGKDLAGV